MGTNETVDGSSSLRTTERMMKENSHMILTTKSYPNVTVVNGVHVVTVDVASTDESGCYGGHYTV